MILYISVITNEFSILLCLFGNSSMPKVDEFQYTFDHLAEIVKEMLGHCKMLLERGYIAINPTFDKLITSLRTAVAEENILDKESTSYADIFDAYRLALKHYQFANSETNEDIAIAVKKENKNQRSQRNQRNA